MNINSINFNSWKKNTHFPESIGDKADYSIKMLGNSKKFECSYSNGILKATKSGEDVFIKKTTPNDFSKNIILMHKTILPNVRTLEEIFDRLSLEA